MSSLVQEIWRACADLDLTVELDFHLTLNGDQTVRALARIAGLGAPNGMLVFASYDEFRSVKDDLLDAGYGFSVLDEPAEGEEYDLESFKTMFRDWGWTGPLGQKPAWLR